MEGMWVRCNSGVSWHATLIGLILVLVCEWTHSGVSGESPFQSITTFDTVSMMLGAKGTLTATYMPPDGLHPTFTWTFNSAPIGQASDSTISTATNTLTNSNWEVGDGGQYIFRARKTNYLRIATFNVTILVPPKLKSPTGSASNLTVVLGSTVTFTVQFVSPPNPSPLLTWFYGKGVELNRTTPVGPVTSASYVIKSAQLSDNGSYQLSATNGVGQLNVPFTLKVLVPPKFRSNVTSVSGVYGSSVKLVGQFNNMPTSPTWYRWELNGVALSKNSSHLVKSSNLTIPSLDAADTGSYILFVNNSAGSDSMEFIVSILVPPQFTRNVTSVSGVRGQNITLAGLFGNAPMPHASFSWKLNGAALPTSGLLRPNGSSLTISSLDVADAGNYTLFANNSIGSDSIVFVLSVLVPPQFTRNVTPLNGVLGGNVTLLGLFGNAPMPHASFVWKLNGSALPTNGLLRPDGSSLTISSLDVADAGNYTLFANNSIGSDSIVFVLSVLVPPEFVLTTQTVEAIIGSPIVLRMPFVYTPHPLPIYSWLMLQCQSSNCLLSSVGPTLSITPKGPAGTLNYSLTATNAAGSDQVTFTVSVKEPPLPQVRYVVNSTSITAYLPGTDAQYNIGLKPCMTISALALPSQPWASAVNTASICNSSAIITAGSLHEFTTYSVFVKLGSLANVQTATVNVTTQAAAPASAPRGFQAVNITTATLDLQWQPLAPEDLNGHFVEYKVSITSLELATRLVILSNHTTASVLGLVPHSNYTFSLSVVSSGGESVNTAITVSTIRENCTTMHLACQANSVCTVVGKRRACVCKQGFSANGTLCLDDDECDTGMHSCPHNSLCSNIAGSYTCQCTVGYEARHSGMITTCVDSDECKKDPDTCPPSAACFNTLGSYTCQCSSGFHANSTASAATICQDDDECGSRTHNCPALAICSNSPGSYSCGCAVGYQDDPSNTMHILKCIDFDECSNGGHTCPALAICSNSVGSYSCACIAGYTQDPSDKTGSLVCKDVDECSGGGQSCPAHSACMNTDGTFQCSCHAGYQPHISSTGRTCEDENECLNGQHSCPANSSCVNSNGSYSCPCLIGYQAKQSSLGLMCEDVNECTSARHTCPANSSCVNSRGSYTCPCDTGYQAIKSRSGLICDDVNECMSGQHSCPANSSCVNDDGSYTCPCNIGYQAKKSSSGLMCDADVDECSAESHGCSQNATCTNTAASYTCSCQRGYSGDARKNCSDVNECLAGSHNCSDTATCVNVAGAYNCTCGDGALVDDLASCVQLTPRADDARSKWVFIGLGVGVILPIAAIVLMLGAKKRMERSVSKKRKTSRTALISAYSRQSVSRRESTNLETQLTQIMLPSQEVQAHYPSSRGSLGSDDASSFTSSQRPDDDDELKKSHVAAGQPTAELQITRQGQQNTLTYLSQPVLLHYSSSVPVDGGGGMLLPGQMAKTPGAFSMMADGTAGYDAASGRPTAYSNWALNSGTTSMDPSSRASPSEPMLNSGSTHAQLMGTQSAAVLTGYGSNKRMSTPEAEMRHSKLPTCTSPDMHSRRDSLYGNACSIVSSEDMDEQQEWLARMAVLRDASRLVIHVDGDQSVQGPTLRTPTSSFSVGADTLRADGTSSPASISKERIVSLGKGKKFSIPHEFSAIDLASSPGSTCSFGHGGGDAELHSRSPSAAPSPNRQDRVGKSDGQRGGLVATARSGHFKQPAAPTTSFISENYTNPADIRIASPVAPMKARTIGTGQPHPDEDEYGIPADCPSLPAKRQLTQPGGKKAAAIVPTSLTVTGGGTRELLAMPGGMGSVSTTAPLVASDDDQDLYGDIECFQAMARKETVMSTVSTGTSVGPGQAPEDDCELYGDIESYQLGFAAAAARSAAEESAKSPTLGSARTGASPSPVPVDDADIYGDIETVQQTFSASEPAKPLVVSSPSVGAIQACSNDSDIYGDIECQPQPPIKSPALNNASARTVPVASHDLDVYGDIEGCQISVQQDDTYNMPLGATATRQDTSPARNKSGPMKTPALVRGRPCETDDVYRDPLDVGPKAAPRCDLSAVSAIFAAGEEDYSSPVNIRFHGREMSSRTSPVIQPAAEEDDYKMPGDCGSNTLSSTARSNHITVGLTAPGTPHEDAGDIYNDPLDNNSASASSESMVANREGSHASAVSAAMLSMCEENYSDPANIQISTVTSAATTAANSAGEEEDYKVPEDCTDLPKSTEQNPLLHTLLDTQADVYSNPVNIPIHLNKDSASPQTTSPLPFSKSAPMTETSMGEDLYNCPMDASMLVTNRATRSATTSSQQSVNSAMGGIQEDYEAPSMLFAGQTGAGEEEDMYNCPDDLGINTGKVSLVPARKASISSTEDEYSVPCKSASKKGATYSSVDKKNKRRLSLGIGSLKFRTGSQQDAPSKKKK